jgi:hypothetical protein
MRALERVPFGFLVPCTMFLVTILYPYTVDHRNLRKGRRLSVWTLLDDCDSHICTDFLSIIYISYTLIFIAIDACGL